MERDACVILFLKAPEKGRVKTRLAADLGEQTALDLYRCFVEDTLAMLHRVGFLLRIYCDPPASQRRMAQWLGDRHPILPQTGCDLGERMRNAFQETFSLGTEAALLIGSDSPDLPDRYLREAVSALGNHDAVLGPAQDGGYCLIGFRRENFLSDAFAGIPWSTPEVLARTLSILNRAGRRVHLLPWWRDVDTVEDLRALVARNHRTAFTGSATMNRLRTAYGEGAIPDRREQQPSLGKENGMAEQDSAVGNLKSGAAGPAVASEPMRETESPERR